MQFCPAGPGPAQHRPVEACSTLASSPAGAEPTTKGLDPICLAWRSTAPPASLTLTWPAPLVASTAAGGGGEGAELGPAAHAESAGWGRSAPHRAPKARISPPLTFSAVLVDVEAEIVEGGVRNESGLLGGGALVSFDTEAQPLQQGGHPVDNRTAQRRRASVGRVGLYPGSLGGKRGQHAILPGPPAQGADQEPRLSTGWMGGAHGIMVGAASGPGDGWVR